VASNRRYYRAIVAGREYFVQQALDERGNLAAICGLQPPRERLRDLTWLTGYCMGRSEVMAALLPDHADLDEFLETHEPDDEDAAALERFAERGTPGAGERFRAGD
jgi:hypothetical protein